MQQQLFASHAGAEGPFNAHACCSQGTRMHACMQGHILPQYETGLSNVRRTQGTGLRALLNMVIAAHVCLLLVVLQCQL